MFKNATIYRITTDFNAELADVIKGLEATPFVECPPSQKQSTGWVAPREENGPLCEAVDGHLILKLRTDTRKVPPEAVAKRTEEIAKQIEETTGRKPGRKQLKEIKEQALQELLPLAFIKSSFTTIWIDRQNRMVIMDATGGARCDAVITMLVKSLEGLALANIHTQMSPTVAMTHWLGTGEAPYSFSVDNECELHSQDEMKSVIKYSRHSLDTEEVRNQVKQGKIPTKVALTWRDRISVLLTSEMTLKKVAFLDVVFEGKVTESKAEEFDANFAIMTGEFIQLIPDLLEALGGEQVKPGDAQQAESADEATAQDSEEALAA